MRSFPSPVFCHFLAVCVLASGVVLAVSPARAEEPQAGKSDPPKLRGLLVTGGCCHDYPRQIKIITEGLSQRISIAWDVVHEDDGRLHQISIYKSPDWSKGYDVVVHNECYGAVEDIPFVKNIVEGHTATGVPAIFIHCSMHSYRAAQTDDWRKLVGVTSRRHEKGGRQLDISNVAPRHPIMAGFPERWKTPNGELYVIENIWPNTTPLATAYGVDTKKNQLCVWTNKYGNARVFGTTLGHHNETMMSKPWLDTVARGVLWSVEKLEEDGSAEPGYEGTGPAPFSFQRAPQGEPTPAQHK